MKHPSILMVIAISVAMGLILISHFLLDNRVKDQRALAINNNRAAVLTSVNYDTIGKSVLTNNIPLTNTTVHQLMPVYKQSAIQAWLIHATTHNGYGGDIEFFMVKKEGGFFPPLRIFKHQETPGIADFLKDNRITLIVDGVSGATITSTSLNQAIRHIEQWFAQCVQQNNIQYLCS